MLLIGKVIILKYILLKSSVKKTNINKSLTVSSNSEIYVFVVKQIHVNNKNIYKIKFCIENFIHKIDILLYCIKLVKIKKKHLYIFESKC